MNFDKQWEEHGSELDILKSYAEYWYGIGLSEYKDNEAIRVGTKVLDIIAHELEAKVVSMPPLDDIGHSIRVIPVIELVKVLNKYIKEEQ